MRSISVMEWNLNTPLEWEWENLAIYSGRAVEIPKHVQLSNDETEGNVVVDNASVYTSGSGGFSGSALEHGSLYNNSFSVSVGSSSKEKFKTFEDIDGFPNERSGKEEFLWVGKNENFPNMVEASVVSGEPIVGLKLGRQTNCEDMCAASTTNTPSFSVMATSSSPTSKRSRASYQSSQSPRCQVEGCNLDLASAKDYHRRHRICESHSKSPKVILAGMERRFCQQCSRFHDLSEFDDKKRSCRRRLSAHNARRRRPQPEDIQFGSQLSSSLCGTPPNKYYDMLHLDRRSQMNFLVNRVPIPAPNPMWETACNFKVTLGGESLLSFAKGGDIDAKPQFPSDVMPNDVSSLHLNSDGASSSQGIPPRILSHGLQASTITSNSLVAPEFRRAFSLLSTTSWGLNEPESTSLDQFVNGNGISLAQPGMPSTLQNWEPSSEYVPVKQTQSQPQVHKSDLQNISSGQLLEFHSSRTLQESECFNSNMRN